MNDRDYTSDPGSAYLQSALRTFWALRTDGETAPTFVRAFVAGNPRGHSRRFDLRSDMVDGTPRGFAWRWDAKKRKWGLVKNERAGTANIPPEMVGADDTGRKTRVRGETQRQAPRKSLRRHEARLLQDAASVS
jgi:hypothetical protein